LCGKSSLQAFIESSLICTGASEQIDRLHLAKSGSLLQHCASAAKRRAGRVVLRFLFIDRINIVDFRAQAQECLHKPRIRLRVTDYGGESLIQLVLRKLPLSSVQGLLLLLGALEDALQHSILALWIFLSTPDQDLSSLFAIFIVGSVAGLWGRRQRWLSGNDWADTSVPNELP
jgi:hypothetical protein